MKALHGNNRGRTVTLVIVLVLIAAAILFLNSRKPAGTSGTLRAEISVQGDSARIQQKERIYPKAVELVSPDGYINTGPITLKELVGKKVVLIDFWTYSCINCQRTLPYLRAWYDKYKDYGLVIIGVHTPEFDFEKSRDNVQQAVEKFGITYPVVQDNQYQTWTAYGNHYWPHKYLIDIDGFVVYDHIGEGGYADTEKKIQELLDERSRVLSLGMELPKNISQPAAPPVDFGSVGTPELYFGYGYQRPGQFGNTEGYSPNQAVQYSIPANPVRNKFYLEGEWLNNNDNMELQSPSGKILLKYDAKNVHLVAGAARNTTLSVKVDGMLVNDSIVVSSFSLYTVVSGKGYGAHTLEIVPDRPGLMAYTFTFG